MANEIQTTIKAHDLTTIADIVGQISAHTDTQEFSLTFKIPDLTDLQATKIEEYIEEIITATPDARVEGKITRKTVREVCGTPRPVPAPPNPQTSMLDDDQHLITISHGDRSVTMTNAELERAADVITRQPIDLGGL